MTKRHWTAGSKLPPADYAPVERENPLTGMPEDLFPLDVRQRLDLEQKQRARRAPPGAVLIYATFTLLGMFWGAPWGALLMWLVMR